MNSKERALKEAIGSKSYAPRMNSKSKALEYFKAKKNHKKRPIYETPEKKQTEYKKLSIEDFEKKYL